MTNTQLFFAIAALFVAQTGTLATAFKLYLDAKIDPLQKQIDLLVKYMIDHEQRISRLEGKQEVLATEKK